MDDSLETDRLDFEFDALEMRSRIHSMKSENLFSRRNFAKSEKNLITKQIVRFRSIGTQTNEANSNEQRSG